MLPYLNAFVDAFTYADIVACMDT